MKNLPGLLARGFAPLQRHAVVVFTVVAVLLLVAVVLLVGWLGPTWEWRGHRPLGDAGMRVAACVILAALPLLVWSWCVHRRNRRLQHERRQHTRHVEDACLVCLQAQQRSLDASLARLSDTHRGRNALYQIPWYLVLGEENAGKSSFISRSSQRFAVTRAAQSAERRGQQDPDLAFAIDWWIGDEAVLIDPPGAFISQPERPDPEPPIAHAEPQDTASIEPLDGPASQRAHAQPPVGLPAGAEKRLWHHLIGWLASNRSRRPLNGVMLMVDMVGLLGREPKDRRNLAYLLRARFAELSNALGTRLPVYVVMSKFDLLEGFEELFATLPAAVREEVMGFTFNLDSVQEFDAWLGELGRAYDGFLDRLNAQALLALSDAGGREQRESLFSMMRQLCGARDILLGFLEDVLGSDRYTTPALVRGVYLSSVYQRGTVFNLFVAASARAYAFPAPLLSVKPQGRSVVYFAQHLLRQVVYPEAGLAGDNLKVVNHKRRLLMTGSVLASLASLVLLGGWSHFYGINRDKAALVLEKSQAFNDKNVGLKPDASGLALLLPLEEIRAAVAIHGNYRTGWSLLADMGLYQGQAIGPMVDQAYLNLLSRRFLPAIASGVAQAVKQAAPGSDQQLAALRVYRMLEDRENRRPEIVKAWMARQWQALYPGQGQVQAALMHHLDYALKYAHAELPAHRPLVAQAQGELRKLPLAQRVYMTLKQQAEAQLHGKLDLRNEIGPAFDIVYQVRGTRDGGSAADQRLAIEPLLTAKGFRGYFEQHSQDVADLALIDQWVLGERRSIDYSEADRQALTDRLRALYSADYVDSWRRALNQFAVTDFADLAQATSVLEQVTGPAAPMRRLLEAVRDNSVIYPQAAGTDAKTVLAGAVQQQAVGIQRAFAGLSGMLSAEGDKPSYYEETLQAISAVHDYAKAVQDNPNRGKAALGAVMARFTQAEPDPIRNLQRIASGLPEPLNRQVRHLADQSAQVLMVAALRELEQRWEADVYSVYRERLAPRYPFSPAGEDVSLKDFEAFFGPQGHLQRFQDEYLKVFLTDNLDALYSESKEGYLIRPEVLTQLKHVERIRTTFFDNRGALNVAFTLEPLGLSGTHRSSVFDIDGQLYAYSHGPRAAVGLSWPGPQGESGSSRVTLVKADGMTSSLGFRGPWSFYRLLSHGQLNARTDTSVDLSFRIAGGVMRYKVYAESANNPFTQRPFNGFELPRTLLSDAH